METKFSLISEITLPLGSVCSDGPYAGAGLWINFLVAMPRVYVFQYSMRPSSERNGMEIAVSALRRGQPWPTDRHRRIRFTDTTLYSPWPVGQEYDNARDLSDLFLSRFFQWPAAICSDRSDVFKTSFASISEQADTTVTSLQGILLCPLGLP